MARENFGQGFMRGLAGGVGIARAVKKGFREDEEYEQDKAMREEIAQGTQEALGTKTPQQTPTEAAASTKEAEAGPEAAGMAAPEAPKAPEAAGIHASFSEGEKAYRVLDRTIQAYSKNPRYAERVPDLLLKRAELGMKLANKSFTNAIDAFEATGDVSRIGPAFAKHYGEIGFEVDVSKTDDGKYAIKMTSPQGKTMTEVLDRDKFTERLMGLKDPAFRKQLEMAKVNHHYKIQEEEAKMAAEAKNPLKIAQTNAANARATLYGAQTEYYQGAKTEQAQRMADAAAARAELARAKARGETDGTYNINDQTKNVALMKNAEANQTAIWGTPVTDPVSGKVSMQPNEESLRRSSMTWSLIESGMQAPHANKLIGSKETLLPQTPEETRMALANPKGSIVVQRPDGGGIMVIDPAGRVFDARGRQLRGQDGKPFIRPRGKALEKMAEKERQMTEEEQDEGVPMAPTGRPGIPRTPGYRGQGTNQMSGPITPADSAL